MKVYALLAEDEIELLNEVIKIFKEREEAERVSQKCDAIARAKHKKVRFSVLEVDLV